MRGGGAAPLFRAQLQMGPASAARVWRAYLGEKLGA